MTERTSSSSSPSPLEQFSGAVADLVERATPSVVHVHARRGRPAHGVAFGKELVLSMNHAVERDSDIRVRTREGADHAASIAGRDPATNLIVLRAAGLSAPAASQASRAPRVGDVAVAVGWTADSGPLADVNFVASVGGRVRFSRGRTPENLVRLTGGQPSVLAGAPVFDHAAGLIGVVSVGAWRAAGIVLPAAHVLSIGAALAERGGVARGYLGIMCQSVDLPERQQSGAAASRGLLIVGFERDGAADRAGLLVGDIIVRFADRATPTHGDLQDVLAAEAVGSARPVQVIRGGQLTTVEVTVGARP